MSAPEGAPVSEQALRLLSARNIGELRRVIASGEVTASAELVAELRARADALERGDPRSSLACAEAVLSVAKYLGDEVAQATGLWAKANALRRLGKYRRSLQLYERASQLFRTQGRETEAARTEIGKTDVLMYQGRYAEALASAERARQALLDLGEVLQAAKLDANTGNIYHRLDLYEDALRLYDRARGVFVEHGENVLAASVDVNRANVLTLLDRFREAETVYLEARTICEQAGLRSSVAAIDANLGFLYAGQGRYNQAVDRLELARQAYRELGEAPSQIQVALDLADVYLTLNLVEDAIGLAATAEQSARRLGMRLEAARAMAAEAFGYDRLGDPATATRLLARARWAFQEEGNEVWTAILDLHESARVSRTSGAGRADSLISLRRCRAAREIFERRGLTAKAAYAALVEGRLCELLGQAAEAGPLYRMALDEATRLHLPWLLYQVNHALGRYAQREGAPREEVKRWYLLAAEALETMWGDLKPEDLRTAFLSDRLDVYEDLVLLALSEGQTGLREAFQQVERAKSRALLDLLAGRLEVRVRDGENEAAAERLRALREELNWFYSRLSEGGGPGGSQRRAWVAAVAEQVQEREAEATRLLRQLQLRGEEYAALQRAEPTTLDKLQRRLDDETTLVEYYLVEGRFIAFVIDREGLCVETNLGTREEVAAEVRRLAHQFAKFSLPQSYVERHLAQLSAATEEHLRALYDLLVGPLRGRLRGRRLVVVPHDLLHHVPFHALHDGERYLVDEFEVSYSPSASILDLCLDRPERPIRRALVMGVPDERAPLVADEVVEVGASFVEPLVFLSETATAEALRRHGSHSDVVHIASHGVFSRANPMFSRLRMADGWLSVHDVYDLTLDASLVTLSACETGLSEVAPGDEVIGLARGFFYAGTRSLLLSLWAVNDAATRQLMRSFYKRLLAGEGKAAALRGAQLEVKKVRAHPYYWAPFVLLGRWE